MPAPAVTIRAALVAAVLLSFGGPVAGADYYAGKTVEMIVGGGPGGGYDIYARTVARHLGRHIPGEPSIVVKNMPGAGSGKAAQYVSSIAPKDGTSMAAIMPGAIMSPLLDERGASAPLFDPTKVKYIGTANNGTRVCVTLKGTKIASMDDARRVKAKFGGSGPNDSTFEYGYLHRHTSGALWDIVPGYRGTPDMALAMERGEIDGACGWDWASLKSQRPDWIRDGKINVLLQDGLEPNPELTRMGVPSVFKYVTNEEDRKVVELIISQQVFQRSYIAAPGLSAEQLETLRSAFDATVGDQEFLKDAQTLRIDVSPLPGAKVQDLVTKLYAAPKDIVARARQAISP
jgi:tripartite-type tricarboxylate transporter receptor subunit TctC